MTLTPIGCNVIIGKPLKLLHDPPRLGLAPPLEFEQSNYPRSFAETIIRDHHYLRHRSRMRQRDPAQRVENFNVLRKKLEEIDGEVLRISSFCGKKAADVNDIVAHAPDVEYVPAEAASRIGLLIELLDGIRARELFMFEQLAKDSVAELMVAQESSQDPRLDELERLVAKLPSPWRMRSWRCTSTTPSLRTSPARSWGLRFASH